MELESQLSEITALKLTALLILVFFGLFARGVLTSFGVTDCALIGDRHSGRASVRFIVFRKIDFLGPPVIPLRKLKVGLYYAGGERSSIDFNCTSFDKLRSSLL